MTEYTGIHYTDEDARQFVKEYMEQHHDGSIDSGDIVNCAIWAWETFMTPNDEEDARYNELEQLRWVYTVLHELVGDSQKVPTTWN
jgi:hypothetical protein